MADYGRTSGPKVIQLNSWNFLSTHTVCLCYAAILNMLLLWPYWSVNFKWKVIQFIKHGLLSLYPYCTSQHTITAHIKYYFKYSNFIAAVCAESLKIKVKAFKGFKRFNDFWPWLCSIVETLQGSRHGVCDNGESYCDCHRIYSPSYSTVKIY